MTYPGTYVMSVKWIQNVSTARFEHADFQSVDQNLEISHPEAQMDTPWSLDRLFNFT